ncbi:oligoketide cyclase/lipid transport protein [Candidatus Scalindua japonica]|uniref:Oligoketide cyclase/lipid transport protein n=1 Tax=Candidatus Scalindua japonica TaxID=1284222 RepID=A0A286TTI5_9BACT|nr:SRPBCC family protein [Candidatus Scalindua japonica]GAX59165.1 oligoketide cyclase/lipid transport protein [Candidatus Scalindua japonica]
MNIHKYIKINVSKENTLQELLTFEEWSQWWPGVQSVNVVKKEGSLSVLDVVSRESHITIKSTIEFDLTTENSIKFRQIKGWFKRYEGNWTFMPATDGAGIILKISVMLETGKFVPKSIIYSKFLNNLTQLGEALNKRLAYKRSPVTGDLEQQKPIDQIPHPTVGSEGIDTRTRAKKSICIFQTKKGLEVWLSGKRYLMSTVK